MKRLLQSIVLGMVIAAFALPALAQNTTTAQPAQDTAEQEAKSALYKKFTEVFNRGREIIKADPKLEQPGNKEAYAQANKEANQYATEYLQKYPSDTGQIPDYLKKFVANYEKSVKAERKNQLAQLFKDKNYDRVFSLGREILTDEPNDLFTLYNLARAGLFAATDGKENFNADTANYARQAIRLIESGQSFTPGQSMNQKEKDETLGLLNYALGVATIKNTPGDAVGAFIKVASIEGDAKKDAQTYYLLAVSYHAADYDKLDSDFKAHCTTEEQLNSPTCTAMKNRLNLVVDRVIDAYARAVAFSGTNPKYATKKTEWMDSLTQFYKYRHEGSDAGLKEYIAGIMNQPLPGPLPAASMTTSPTTATPSTPATTAPSSNGNGSSASTGTATTMTPTATTTTTAKPASTTTTPKATTPAKTTTTKTTPRKAHAAGRRH